MTLALKQYLLLCLTAASMTVFSTWITLYSSGHQALSLSLPDFSSSDTPQKMISSLDAANFCQQEAVEKFEGKLLYSSVNWHSTRYEPSREEFMVLLNGTVGSHSKSESANIYCYVSPTGQDVSYFRAYDSNNKPMLSQGLNLDILKSFGD